MWLVDVGVDVWVDANVIVVVAPVVACCCGCACGSVMRRMCWCGGCDKGDCKAEQYGRTLEAGLPRTCKLQPGLAVLIECVFHFLAV